MADPKLISARVIAIKVLNQCDPKRNYVGKLLERAQHETDQKQRATDLVFGTLRNRNAIDMVIAKFSGRPVKRIQNKLLNIIRVGTYELIYRPSVEQYAIVNEAVAISKAAGAVKQSGFVNAVLRQITRHISNRQVVLAECDVECVLPQDSMTGCQFDTAFLSDFQLSPAKYLSTVFSLPEWLIAGWLVEFGEESTRQICLASNRRPSLYLRPNPLKTTTGKLTEKLRDDGVDLEVNADGLMIRIKSPRAISKLAGFEQGEFSIQDISASKPVKNLEFRMKNSLFSILNTQFSILDLCAAPGTKTTQLAEVTSDMAKIIATDIDSHRLEMVKENVTRLDMKNIDIVPYEDVFNSQSQFDCVLLDVPCSNTGVLAKRIEVRYRINPQTITELATKQSELLRTAVGIVKQGGKICYSTCSIQKRENSELIEGFLKENQNFTLESEQLTLPSAEGFDHDGGYFAILTKH